MAEPNELAKWMTPDGSEVRVNRMWARLSEAEQRRGSRRWAALVSAGVAIAAVIIGVVALPAARVLSVGVEVSAPLQPLEARFSDGSRVELAEAAAVELLAESPSEMRVGLSRGAATFEVSKRPTRHFIVEAAGVEVKVVGTRFTVQRDGSAVDVSVERGIVEVTSAGKTVRLTAGQQWQSAQPQAIAAPAPAALPSPVSDAVAEAAPVKEAAPHPPRHEAHGVREHLPRAEAAAAAPSETAAETLKSALAARRDGRSADAALGLERLLRDHPQDARAPLAAFELGRLRMDELDDPRGATESLELSLHLSPRGPFAEEALSRLVKAYDARRLTAPCQYVRDQYLSRFPNGAYADSVKGRCGQ